MGAYYKKVEICVASTPLPPRIAFDARHPVETDVFSMKSPTVYEDWVLSFFGKGGCANVRRSFF
jgi:hypothetical protein